MSRPTPGAAALRRAMHLQLMTGRALLVLAELSERATIAGDTRALESLEPKQRGLLEQSSAHEFARRMAAAELAVALGLDGAATLKTLLGALLPGEAAQLIALRSQILDVNRRLERINASNARLLRNALGYVQFNLNALTSAALKPAKYGVNLAQISAPSFYVDSKA